MPNDDYIKRSDAFDAIVKWERERQSESDLIMAIATIMECVVNEVPAADVEPKQKWIPVTERLPEVDKEVLVFAVGKSNDFSSVIAITDRMIFRLFPSSEGVETWRSPWQYFMTNYEITHWMPLPEPPKEKDHE